jgi:SET domain-containing protein
MLVIRKSRIQGVGLFTDRPLRAREKIGEYTGERISVAEGRRRAKGKSRIAIVEVSSRIAIDGDVNGGPFRFINHSCTPNVFTRIAYGRMEFYALRRIKAGEELTCDYSPSQHDGKLACRCGSASCREFV